MFATRDISAVKSYCERQFDKIQQGLEKVFLQDFIFSKEVKIGHYRGQPPPGAEVVLNKMLKDPMAEPPYKWRVPYVIVCGTQSSRLMDLAVDPMELLKRGSSYRINSTYYITKCVLPALDRMLGLCGVRVKDWFDAMKKRKLRVRHVVYENINNSNSSNNIHHSYRVHVTLDRQQQLRQQSMDQFALRGSCESCGGNSVTAVCPACSDTPADTLSSLQSTLNGLLSAEQASSAQCSDCARMRQPMLVFAKDQLIGPHCCSNLDCAKLYQRCRLVIKIENSMHAQDALIEILKTSW